MEKWYEIRKSGDFRDIALQFGIDPVTARVIRNRGVTGREEIRKYLYGTLSDMDDPCGLTGIESAAAVLSRKIREGKTIRIIGDYDIDGVCATYILMKGLGSLGAKVSYDIPERLTDGYGLNIRLVQESVSDGIDTMVTVDNGIAALAQVRLAKDSGMTVIVTDHHQPPYEEKDGTRIYRIPEADVVVDPNLNGCPYPNKALCGAGVAWKLLHVMESRCLTSESCPDLLPVEECPLTYSLLPFAAFATVGDVMDLTGENRILVRYGLKMLPDVSNIGMRSLIEACGLKGKKLTAYSIGFVLGPCINAGGRLKSAHEAEELFLTEDPLRACHLAQELSSLNEERKALTDTGLNQALGQLRADRYTGIGSDPDEGEEEEGRVPEAFRNHPSRDRVLVLYLPGTHESIVGIIAGKVREKTGKPAFVLTDAQEDGMLKGSGRSIDEYSMFDELVKCSDLLEKFGGHPMAAGLSLKKNNLEIFRKKLNEFCSLTEEDIAKKVLFDARLPLSAISDNLVQHLHLTEPFGKGNPAPLFAERDLAVLSARVLGVHRNCVKMTVSDGKTRMNALYFGEADEFLEKLSEKAGREEVRRLMNGLDSHVSITAVFYPDVNEYRGNRELQIHITNFR